jgi:hypothetical protein
MNLLPEHLDSTQDLERVVRYLLKSAVLVKTLPVGSYQVPVYEHQEIQKFGVWGFAQLHPEYRIWIDARVPRHQRRRTVLHEAVEIINDAYDLGLDETKVRVFDQTLWPLLKQI